jgi:hypothetical protein
VDMSVGAYRQAGVTSLSRPPELDTGHGDRSSTLELAINGCTYEGSKRKSSRKIRLTFHEQSFWIQDFLSLGYVFAHECIAHGFCGINIELPSAERSKSFHDGWMDCIAARVLYRALAADDAPRFASEIWRQTECIHARRYGPHSHRDRYDWLAGKRALETLWWLFAQVQDSKLDRANWKRSPTGGRNGFSSIDWQQASAESLKSLLRLSLRINASNLTHGERGRFVAVINKCYSRTDMGKQVDALIELPQILDYISKYCAAQNNETDFVHKVVALG